MQIEFKDVKMRYRPGLPLVLKGLNVCIEAGTTCGVVGRTGKSAFHFCLSSLGFCPLSVAMHGWTANVVLWLVTSASWELLITSAFWNASLAY